MLYLTFKKVLAASPRLLVSSSSPNGTAKESAGMHQSGRWREEEDDLVEGKVEPGEEEILQQREDAMRELLH